jgi:cell division protein FtsB
MFDFHQKRKIRAVLGSRITQVIILVITAWVLLSVYERFLIAREMSERREAVEQEIEALTNRKNNLEAEVKYLSNERGIEAEMRRQFDIAREGEQVVIIVEDENKPVETTPVETPTTTKRAWYKFW